MNYLSDKDRRRDKFNRKRSYKKKRKSEHDMARDRLKMAQQSEEDLDNGFEICDDDREDVEDCWGEQIKDSTEE